MDGMDDESGSASLDLQGEQLSGQCGSKGRNFRVVANVTHGSINVALGLCHTRALVDTGSSLSFVSQNLFDKISGTKACTQTRRSTMTILLADGKPITAEFSAVFNVSIKGKNFKQRFYVLKELNHQMILGVNFLKTYKGRVSFSGDVPTPTNAICAMKTVRVPANSECTFNGLVINKDSLENQTGITENTIQNPKYMIKHTIVTPKTDKNIIPVTIANPTDEVLRIERRSIVGYLSPLNMDDAIPLGPIQDDRAHLNSLEETDQFLPINCGDNPEDTLPKEGEPLKYKVADNLTIAQKKQIKKIIESNREAFVINNNAIGLNTDNEVTLVLKPGAIPCNRPSYRMSPHKEVFQRELLKQQLEQGVLEICSEPSEYNSPAFLVAKPQGDTTKASGWRIVVDYRWVNANLKSFSYSFPRADDLMNTIGRAGPQFYSKLDVFSAYHQVSLAKESRHITTFSANGTRYRAKVLPMGLKTSGLAFQNVMEQLLIKCKYRNAVAYVDDVAIYSPTWERHMEDLDEVLKLFIKGNIKLKSEKCEFGTTGMDFLGFRVGREGLSPSPEKIWPIKTFPEPKNVAQLRSFNGMAQFYKRFVKGFAHVMKPLYELLKTGKTFKWTTECQRSFDSIKNSICADATLKFPEYEKPFVIFTDASDISCGAVICQCDINGFYRPIEFAGASLTEQERRYSVTDREMLGIIFAVKRFHHYVDGTHFTVYSDHTALVSLFNKKENITNGRLARWVDTVMAYDMEVKYLQGRANIVADMLSRRHYPAQEDDPTPTRSQGKLKLPDKKLKFGSILITKFYKANDVIPENPILLGAPRSILKGGKPWGASCTKVKGVIAKKNSPERMDIERGLCEETALNAITRANRLLAQPNVVIHEIPTTPANHPRHLPRVVKPNPPSATSSTEVTAPSVVIHDTPPPDCTPSPSRQPQEVPRKRRPNSRSPAIPVSVAADKRRKAQITLDPIAEEAIRFLSNHVSFNPTSSELRDAQQSDLFSAAMYKYLTSTDLPDCQSLARQILLYHEQFDIFDGILYKTTHAVLGRNLHPTMQIVIPEAWAIKIIESTHCSPLGGHLGSTRTYNSVRSRYYWRGMFKDVHDYVGTCHSCLTTKKKPKNLVTPMVLREPVLTAYTHLTMDVIGPFSPSTDGSKYIHVVVDHATRHITAWTSKEHTTATIALEFFNRVICQHGCPSVLNTDNASVYVSKDFEEMCIKFGIKHVTGSAFHSASQGLVERQNLTVQTCLRGCLQDLRKLVSNAHEYWALFIPPVVFSINNTTAPVMGYSPNLMLLGRQPFLPTEAALDLYRSHGNNANMASSVKHMLALKDKIMSAAATNMKEAHQKMKDRHDKRALECGFKVGDIVYLHIHGLLKKGVSKKLQPTYSGPYMITKATSPVTFILRRLQDNYVLKKSIHAARLRAPVKTASKMAIFRRLEHGPTPTLFNPDHFSLHRPISPLERADKAVGRPKAAKTARAIRRPQPKPHAATTAPPGSPRVRGTKYSLRRRTNLPARFRD